MAINSQTSQEKLKSQILNSYGKVCYTLTTHEKEIQYLIRVEKIIQILQIILSAISTGTIISVLFGKGIIATIIASIVSLLLLILNSFTLKYDINSELNRHTSTTSDLWLIREKYLTLLTDFEDLNVENIRAERDELLYHTNKVYTESPKTSRRSYKKAQKALKKEEEQFFAAEELNLLLPIALREEKKDKFLK